MVWCRWLSITGWKQKPGRNLLRSLSNWKGWVLQQFTFLHMYMFILYIYTYMYIYVHRGNSSSAQMKRLCSSQRWRSRSCWTESNSWRNRGALHAHNSWVQQWILPCAIYIHVCRSQHEQRLERLESFIRYTHTSVITYYMYSLLCVYV